MSMPYDQGYISHHDFGDNMAHGFYPGLDPNQDMNIDDVADFAEADIDLIDDPYITEHANIGELDMHQNFIDIGVNDPDHFGMDLGAEIVGFDNTDLNVHTHPGGHYLDNQDISHHYAGHNDGGHGGGDAGGGDAGGGCGG
eukprot:CAMPEP_0205814634 /NCGR_PEP_ID=MMETSP0205-20121125/19909_1 /ASSEMBLY_ACC=CAM_ASM_000278 /TAXON_ID=36767 /ORGANISM="Euplotes focardii, Strain TN1" /LENGTH=140 /DNA_ID=CAMNT_0053099151 /DNA_START=100 /DNA_END=518 /DNA_ORIENTATION=+